MTPDGKIVLYELLKQTAPNQPFSIEDLTRRYLSKHNGLKWARPWEVQEKEEIEQFLQEEGLIKECGKTTLYTISDKVEKL